MPDDKFVGDDPREVEFDNEQDSENQPPQPSGEKQAAGNNQGA